MVLVSFRTVLLVLWAFLVGPNNASARIQTRYSKSTNKRKDSRVVRNLSSSSTTASVAHFCLEPSTTTDDLGAQECFPLRPVPDPTNNIDSDTSSTGHVCLEMVRTHKDGETLLEVTFETMNDWILTEAHFWIGDSMDQAPTIIFNLQEVPDVDRFPYFSIMMGHTSENDSDLQTMATTEWNEIINAKEEGETNIVCPSKSDNIRNEEKEETGMRFFSAQAVLAKLMEFDDLNDNAVPTVDNSTITTTFVSAISLNENDAELTTTLESFFITCACSGENSALDGENEQEEELEEENIEGEHEANEMLATLHEEEEEFENGSPQEDQEGKDEGEEEETTKNEQEEDLEEESVEGEHKANEMLATLHEEEEEFEENGAQEDQEGQEEEAKSYTENKQEEELEEENKEVEQKANEMLATLHAEEEFEEALAEDEEEEEKAIEMMTTTSVAPSLSPTSQPSPSSSNSGGEEQDNNEAKTISVAPSLSPTTEASLRHNANGSNNHEEKGPGSSAVDSQPNDVDKIPEGDVARPSKGDTPPKSDSDIANQSAAPSSSEPVVLVEATELELTTSFLVVMPDQKHYIDMLLDQDNLHKTEEQIETSTELHQAWHTFVEQLMAENSIPSVNVTNLSIPSSSVHKNERRNNQGAGNGHRRHRNLKAVTMEWIEDSPDLFKFLITVPCPDNVLEEATQYEDKHVMDIGSPKELLRNNNNADSYTIQATCYKAFGKYRLLHLLGSTLDKKNDDVGASSQGAAATSTEDSDGASQQKVCFDILELTRQAFSKDLLGQDLPDNLPFFISGGKPESCLATGVSTMVPTPNDVSDPSSPFSSDTTERSSSSPSHKNNDHKHRSSVLYELHHQDGSWNVLRVTELIVYFVGSLSLMALLIVIYCLFLPKIELESRNRVTDDWSEPSSVLWRSSLEQQPAKLLDTKTTTKQKRSSSRDKAEKLYPWVD